MRLHTKMKNKEYWLGMMAGYNIRNMNRLFDEIKLTMINSVINSALYDSQFQEAFRSKIIKVVAPASGMSLEQIAKLQALPGLSVEMPSNIITQDIMFHASSDENRFEQLHAALFDDSCKSVIWTLRGGYGSARLLDRLKALTPPRQEKILIGFSDNTALHLFLSQSWHWRTIHASGFAQLLSPEQDPQNYIRIAELVHHQITHQALTDLKPLNNVATQSVKTTGRMQGGNLTLVESSIGTHWEIKTKGTLLFLEEVGEKGYRIDRSLHHLYQAGLLKDVNAIVFGTCSGPDKKGIRVALDRFAQEMMIPVYQTNQFGHDKINYPIKYASMAEITPADDATDYVLTMDVR